MDLLQEQQEQSLDIRKYLDIVLRNWWIIIIPPIITTIAATCWAVRMPKVYQAATLIMVENKQLLNPLIQGLAVTTSVQQRISVLREEILSWPRLAKLVENLGLDDNVDSPAQYEGLINSLKNNINVNMRRNNLIVISYESAQPEKAQTVVKAISDILIASNLSSQSAEAEEAISFIAKQLEYYRVKLEESEDNLRKFKEAYTISLPVAARVNEQIIDLEIQLSQLLFDNTEDHPAVISTQKRIAQLKGAREKELVRMETQGLDVQDAGFQEIAYSVPRQQQELARLLRDTKVNAGLYEQLLQRLESAKISKRLDNEEEGTRFKVLEPPRLPSKPIKPDIFRLILFGFAIVLGLGGGIVFLKELSNASFRSVEEAKKALPLPILGAIAVIDLNRMEKGYAKQQIREEKKKKKQALKGKNIFVRILKAIGL